MKKRKKISIQYNNIHTEMPIRWNLRDGRAYHVGRPHLYLVEVERLFQKTLGSSEQEGGDSEQNIVTRKWCKVYKKEKRQQNSVTINK